MVTRDAHALILEALRSPSWTEVAEAVDAAATWMDHAPPGDPRINTLVVALEPLAVHPKWEVRRTVARVAERGHSEILDRMLAVLIKDVNASVRSLAESSLTRRKDRRRTAALGEQHANRVTAILNDLETRHGIRVRQAAQRATDDIGTSLARELYHEVAKLLTPLALSISRLRSQASTNLSPSLLRELDRIDVDIRRINAVLKAMRDYASPPQLTFERESIAETVKESVEIAQSASDGRVPVMVDVCGDVVAVVARQRFSQALRNVLSNALESYPADAEPIPVLASARAHDGYVVITIEDHGAGMSPEQIRDAQLLFATTKENGTGFGLPLAIAIVESEHNGRLAIESQPGIGTRVIITIPIER